MMGAAAGEAAAGVLGPGPSGPPTNASVYNHGTEANPATGIQWTNGDPLAHTRHGFSTVFNVEPTADESQSSPGITSHETNDSTVGRFWWVRHLRNTQYSVWVRAGILDELE